MRVAQRELPSGEVLWTAWHTGLCRSKQYYKSVETGQAVRPWIRLRIAPNQATLQAVLRCLEPAGVSGAKRPPNTNPIHQKPTRPKRGRTQVVVRKNSIYNKFVVRSRSDMLGREEDGMIALKFVSHNTVLLRFAMYVASDKTEPTVNEIEKQHKHEQDEVDMNILNSCIKIGDKWCFMDIGLNDEMTKEFEDDDLKHPKDTSAGEARVRLAQSVNSSQGPDKTCTSNAVWECNESESGEHDNHQYKIVAVKATCDIKKNAEVLIPYALSH